MESDRDRKSTGGVLELDKDAVCERCGCFGAFHFDGHVLCPECYQGCGSCCPEFGQDDLWTRPAEEGSKGRAAS